MSKRKVIFSSWGAACKRLDLPAYAMANEGETPIEAVCKAIARSTGLGVATCRGDGTALDKGKPSARHYQITLGRPVSQRHGGGWNVECELWVGIPIAEGGAV